MKILNVCLLIVFFSVLGISQSEPAINTFNYNYPSNLSEMLVHPDYELMHSVKDVKHTGEVTEYKSTLTNDQLKALLEIVKNNNRTIIEELMTRMDTVIWFNSFLGEEVVSILANDLSKKEIELIFKN